MPSSFGTALARSAITGKPYSLVETTTWVKTLPDGQTATSVVVVRRMRDAKGRVREEIGDRGVSYSLTDPTGPFTATVFPKAKMAIVNRFPAPKPLTPEEERKAAEDRAQAEEYRKAHPSPDVEELPGKMIAGVYATGQRRTLTLHIGVRVTEETWTASDLKVKVAGTTDDPRPEMGKLTTVVSDLTTTAPDPVLFEIPADYKIEER